MARWDRSQALVDELASHFARRPPRRLVIIPAAASVPPNTVPSCGNPGDEPLDTVKALRAVSAAIETMNRQLEILVGVAAPHANRFDAPDSSRS